MRDIQGPAVKVAPHAKIDGAEETTNCCNVGRYYGRQPMPLQECPQSPRSHSMCMTNARYLVIHFRSNSLVCPWNQKPQETEGQHLVLYRSSLKTCGTRRTIKQWKIFKALSTLFLCRCWQNFMLGAKSIPRMRMESKNLGSISDAIMAARFCKDLQRICNLCKFPGAQGEAKSGQEHAIALSSTKTLWVKTSGPICSVCTAQLASTIKTTKAMGAMAHPCGIEMLTLSGEHATCLPNCIHR